MKEGYELDRLFLFFCIQSSVNPSFQDHACPNITYGTYSK
uniref:Uncharacterized protein n=1 Tax=Rhizophora mucronata TaxID=61149 RepID=A0A2P2PX96_RHIMU